MDQTAAPPTAPAAAKTIHLIRHGVAAHNVCDPATGARPDLTDPRYTDPPLIRQGELQATVLGEQLRRRGLVDGGAASRVTDMDVCDDSGGCNRIELVVCSPLMRCLQTASLAFPSHFQSDGTSDFATTNNGRGDVHVLDRNCKVCCHGHVREAYGMHYPDKRSPLPHLKANFPTVAYHPSLTEHDVDWRPDARETRDDVVQRVREFFAWLIQQPHDNIAIVTHGVWMECALLRYCPEVLEYGKKRVYNCEVYCGKLVETPAGGNVALTDMQQMSFYHG